MDCLFCKMAAGQIKPDVVYEDDQVLAFRDIMPQAPVHGQPFWARSMNISFHMRLDM